MNQHFILSAIPPGLEQASSVVPPVAIAAGIVLVLVDSVRFVSHGLENRALAREEAENGPRQILGSLTIPAIESLKANEWDKWEKKIPAQQVPVFTHLKKLVQGLQAMDLTSEQNTEVDSLITNLDETITLYHKGHSITKTLQSDDQELQRTLESQLHVLTQAATELAATINKEQLSNLQAHSLFLNERYQPLQLDKNVNLKKS